MDAEVRACFTLVPQTSKMLGVDLPKLIAEALALTKTRPPELAAAPTTVELAAAIASAVQADRDPASDEDVRTLLARRQLSELNIGHQIAAHAAHQLGEAIKQNAEHIVNTWRVSLAVEAEALAAAKATVGAGDVEDITHMKNPTVPAAGAWATARTSGARFDTAAKSWWMLASVAGVACNPHRRALVLGSVTLDQWRALPDRPTAWEFLCAGGNLDLATFDSWAERNRALDDELAGEQATLEVEGKLRMKLASGGFVRA